MHHPIKQLGLAEADFAADRHDGMIPGGAATYWATIARRIEKLAGPRKQASG